MLGHFSVPPDTFSPYTDTTAYHNIPFLYFQSNPDFVNPFPSGLWQHKQNLPKVKCRQDFSQASFEKQLLPPGLPKACYYLPFGYVSILRPPFLPPERMHTSWP